MWDLLVRGGRLVDPSRGHDGPADVAVRSGRVSRVGPGLPAEQAVEVVEARGQVVTPGLVDMHTHVWQGGTYWGTDLDALAWRTGVTTWLDAGSAGAYSMDGLRRHTDRTTARVRALINVSGLGLVAETGEHHLLDHLDTDDAVAATARHGDFVCGVKARIDVDTVGPNGIEPLRLAVALARRVERPLMVHIGYAPPTVAEIVPLLSEGDILTHCASGSATGLVADGKLSEAARVALDAGVVFDLGHGAGGFDFDVLETELANGVRPVISSDVHARSVHGPAFDLPSVMSKLLAVGWSLYEVVEAVTARPAAVLDLGDGVGGLAPGSPADLAIFDAEHGRFDVVDVHGGVRETTLRLANTATYVAGRRLAPRPADETRPWISEQFKPIPRPGAA